MSSRSPYEIKHYFTPNLPTQWYVAKGPERVSRLMPTKQDAEEARRDLELTDAMDRRFLAAHDPATYGGG